MSQCQPKPPIKAPPPPRITLASLPAASSGKLPFSVEGYERGIASAQFYAPTGLFNINPAPDVRNLTNLHYFVVQGRLIGGHYEFPLTLNAAPAANGSAEGQLIAYSDTDHTQLVAIGEVRDSPAVIPQYVCRGSASTQLHVHFNDRVGLDLADVYQPLTWNYNCSTVTSFDGSGAYETWALDGWSESSASRTSGYTDSSHQTVQSWTDATFQNTLFCGYQVTIWDGSIAYGTFTGSKSASVSPYFSQTCQPLYYSWKWDY